eukprot:6871721-Lingulodinium_polyedra.AAC.1
MTLHSYLQPLVLSQNTAPLTATRPVTRRRQGGFTSRAVLASAQIPDAPPDLFPRRKQTTGSGARSV